jgi:hypothetical protein
LLEPTAPALILSRRERGPIGGVISKNSVESSINSVSSLSLWERVELRGF